MHKLWKNNKFIPAILPPQQLMQKFQAQPKGDQPLLLIYFPHYPLQFSYFYPYLFAVLFKHISNHCWSFTSYPCLHTCNLCQQNPNTDAIYSSLNHSIIHYSTLDTCTHCRPNFLKCLPHKPDNVNNFIPKFD